MDDLIEALTIFRKYGNPYSPTNCSHDEMTVCIDPDLVSSADTILLAELGFHIDHTGDYFYSFRFGSA